MSPFRNIQETGRPVTIKDEGISIATNVSSIDFVGAGVSGSAVGQAVTELIPGGVGTVVVQEVPTGTIDGVNGAFTLAHIPVSGSLRVFLNGSRLRNGIDFTFSGTALTMILIPSIDSNFFVDYEY